MTSKLTHLIQACGSRESMTTHLQSFMRIGVVYFNYYTTQKMKFSIKNFLSKCDQIRSFFHFWNFMSYCKVQIYTGDRLPFTANHVF